MTDKIIPLADIRYASRVPLVPAELLTPTGLLADTLARPLRDLRISVTDRCNFRCSYCMPREVFDKDYAFLPPQPWTWPMLRFTWPVTRQLLSAVSVLKSTVRAAPEPEWGKFKPLAHT